MNIFFIPNEIIDFHDFPLFGGNFGKLSEPPSPKLCASLGALIAAERRSTAYASEDVRALGSCRIVVDLFASISHSIFVVLSTEFVLF